MLKEKDSLDFRFRKITNEIMHYSDRLKNITPYNPVEITIPLNSLIIEKSLKELAFRQTTGALIIAIRRQTQVYVAPLMKF